MEPQRFVLPAQRPHPLLDVAAAVQFTEDEMVLLKDWVDDVPTDVLDEFLTSSVIEEGTLYYRCDGVRTNLDWALERTSGFFGVDYSALGSLFPRGHGRIPPLIRLVFLCGWTAQRRGDLETTASDAIRLGRLASLLYREPGTTDFLRGTFAENAQHHLIRRILSQSPDSDPGYARLLESLPSRDLHEAYRTALATEALLVIEGSAQILEDLGLHSEAADSDGSWLARHFQVAFLHHAEAGALSSIHRYLRAYDSSYDEMRDLLTLRIEEMNFLEKIRSLLGPGDWRFPAIPRWIDDHRRLSNALLQAHSLQRDSRTPCETVHRQLGELRERFQIVEQGGGCAIHYEYGEEFLWPSKVRVVDNPTGDWWLPAAPAATPDATRKESWRTTERP